MGSISGYFQNVLSITTKLTFQGKTKMLKQLSGILTLGLIVGCASTSILKSASPIPREMCNVSVFTSKDSARSKGDFEELCIVSGTSSGSFSHTVGTAIEKHKDKVCNCGATNAYIQAQDAGTLGTASVTLVGFRFTSNSQISQPVDTQEQFKLAKKCHSKGGVWLNNRCEIELESDEK